jgi:hypothetical protein
MAKNTPAWKIMGLPECPPEDGRGYVNYGTVWCAADGPQTEPLREHLRIAAWSMRYWWTKVFKDILHGLRERRVSLDQVTTPPVP